MQYNLIFSTDNNYLPHLFVTCQSVLNSIENRTSNSTDEIVFNVLVDHSVDLDEAQSKSQHFEKRNQDCGISHKFVWRLIDARIFNTFSSMDREGKTVFSQYYRIIIDRILPAEVSFAAYLDIDMLVLADIRKLFDENPLIGKLLGAVVDPGICALETDEIIATYKDDSNKVITVSKDEYFNSGLLLINLNEWRKQGLTETCLEIASKVNLRFHDQDLLNFACKGKVELLDLSWNFQPAMFYALYNKESGKYDIVNAFTPNEHWKCVTPSAEVFEESVNNPYIIHFNGAKPWVNEFHNVPFFPLKPICPKLYQYKEQWLLLEQHVTEYPASHSINIQAVDPLAIEVNKINIKRRKDRKVMQIFIALSLLMNITTLLLVSLDVI